jgi:hypothetical protein
MKISALASRRERREQCGGGALAGGGTALRGDTAL